jgi:hypothetical protein
MKRKAVETNDKGVEIFPGVFVREAPPSPENDAALEEGFRILREQGKIRADLPRLLAQLIDQGREAEALTAMRDWGRCSRSVPEIWRTVRALLDRGREAAV